MTMDGMILVSVAFGISVAAVVSWVVLRIIDIVGGDE
jgi:hypothetical protein